MLVGLFSSGSLFTISCPSSAAVAPSATQRAVGGPQPRPPRRQFLVSTLPRAIASLLLLIERPFVVVAPFRHDMRIGEGRLQRPLPYRQAQTSRHAWENRIYSFLAATPRSTIASCGLSHTATQETFHACARGILLFDSGQTIVGLPGNPGASRLGSVPVARSHFLHLSVSCCSSYFVGPQGTSRMS